MSDSSSFSVVARARSFRYAIRGLSTLLRSQHNAWIHAASSVAVIAAGLALRLGRLEWCAIILAIAFVWAAEALNTAFEALCDTVSPAMSPLVERAKDIAAGAVLIAAVGAGMIGVLVFFPRAMSYIH